jgi:hypothetical protein
MHCLDITRQISKQYLIKFNENYLKINQIKANFLIKTQNLYQNLIFLNV